MNNQINQVKPNTNTDQRNDPTQFLAAQLFAVQQDIGSIRLYSYIATLSLVMSALAFTLVAYTIYKGQRVVVKMEDGEVRPTWQVADETEQKRFVKIFLDRMVATEPRTVIYKITEGLNMMTDDYGNTMKSIYNNAYVGKIIEDNIISTFEPNPTFIPFPQAKTNSYVYHVTGVKTLTNKEGVRETLTIRYRVSMVNADRTVRNLYNGLLVDKFSEEIISKQISRIDE